MIQEQIEWEKECMDRGSARYKYTQDKLKTKDQGDQADGIKYLLKKRLHGAAARLYDLAHKNVGPNGKYNKLLKHVTMDESFLQMAFVGAQLIFQSLTSNKPTSVLKVTLAISKRLEADMKCKMFEAEFPGYYHTVMKSFNDNNVDGYEHKHNVMMMKFRQFDLDWEDWTPAMKVQIGGKVLRCIMEEFYDVLQVVVRYKNGKGASLLEATPVFDKWMEEFEQEKGFLLPDLLPLKIPPVPWTDLNMGGYYTPRLRAAVPFVKSKSYDHLAFIRKHLPKRHMVGVNKMQNTAWMVNKEVLQVQQQVYQKDLGVGVPSKKTTEIPSFPEHLKSNKQKYTDQQQAELVEWKATAKRVYMAEIARKSKLMAFMQAQRLATELSEWEEFYFVFNCDFRGRVYCATPGLSPQGSDNSKGLLTFAKGVKLGKQGVKWLAIHGANLYGIDKVSFEDRVAWTHNMQQLIQTIADNPIDNIKLWESADKPYQFLAFCFEWRACNYGKNEEYISHLPVGIDGSCNGLQHFSALLRDPVGAHATNLRETLVPEDIYQQVADKCTERLKQIDSPYARKWLKVGITRKCAKRPVMTLPYGATQQSARHYVMEYASDNWDKFNLPEKYKWEVARYLTPILWAAIGDVVVAARVCMKWLQKNMGKDLVHWVTPIGFPVFQCYKKSEAIRVETEICGTITLFYQDYNKEGEPNQYAQRNGIAPNFVHALDSTHMIMTLEHSDLDSFSMIHDDFGTHAGNVDKLAHSIRETFHTLYNDHCPLSEWARQRNVDLLSLPKKGDYNLDEIYKAKYFFA